MGVRILGTSSDGVDAAEDRERFDAILARCGIPRAKGRTVFTSISMMRWKPSRNQMSILVMELIFWGEKPRRRASATTNSLDYCVLKIPRLPFDEGGGAGHTGVDLDDRIIKAVRLQSKLAVAAALDAQLGDDVQSSGAQHLVLVVGQGLGRSHDHRVAGVDAHGVQVLHVTHGDHVALVVAHDLVLDLFPAGDALFHQILSSR